MGCLINLYLVRINLYLCSAAHLDDIALVGQSDYGSRTVASPRVQQPAMLAVLLEIFSVVVIFVHGHQFLFELNFSLPSVPFP